MQYLQNGLAVNEFTGVENVCLQTAPDELRLRS